MADLEEGSGSPVLVVAARALPIPLREAGHWMQRLTGEHPDTDLFAVQDGDHIAVITPAGSDARFCGCVHCWTAYRQSLAAAAGDPFLAVRDRMILCPLCGNKRCPRASHHDNPCTRSNEPGQEGSVYA